MATECTTPTDPMRDTLEVMPGFLNRIVQLLEQQISTKDDAMPAQSSPDAVSSLKDSEPEIIQDAALLPKVEQPEMSSDIASPIEAARPRICEDAASSQAKRSEPNSDAVPIPRDKYSQTSQHLAPPTGLAKPAMTQVTVSVREVEDLDSVPREEPNPRPPNLDAGAAQSPTEASLPKCKIDLLDFDKIVGAGSRIPADGRFPLPFTQEFLEDLKQDAARKTVDDIAAYNRLREKNRLKDLTSIYIFDYDLGEYKYMNLLRPSDLKCE